MEQAQISPTPLTVDFLFIVSLLLAIPYSLTVFALLVLCYRTGEHLSICVLVGLKIFTSVRNVDLGKYEVFVAAGFLFPIITLANFWFLKRLIPVTLAEIYDALPIDATERMFKIWDTARGNRAGKSHPYYFVEPVHEPSSTENNSEQDLNEYRCWMVEKKDE